MSRKINHRATEARRRANSELGTKDFVKFVTLKFLILNSQFLLRASVSLWLNCLCFALCDYRLCESIFALTNHRACPIVYAIAVLTALVVAVGFWKVTGSLGYQRRTWRVAMAV